MTPKFIYNCIKCGKIVNKKPCSKETKALGSWRCSCSGSETKVKREKNA